MKRFSIPNMIAFIALSLTAGGTSFASCHDQIENRFHDNFCFKLLGTSGLVGLAASPWAWPLLLPAELGLWGYVVIANNHHHFSEILTQAAAGGGPAIHRMYERYQNSASKPVSEAEFYKLISKADLDETLCTQNGRIRFPSKSHLVKDLILDNEPAMPNTSESDTGTAQPEVL